MQTPRKQFGRRGLPPQANSQWMQSQPSARSAGVSTAYAGTADGAVSSSDGDGFSIFSTLSHLFVMFFDFQGRIGRLGYWGLGTFNAVASVAITIGYFSSLNLNYDNPEEVSLVLGQADFLPLWLTLLVFAVSNFSLQVRRFHDRDVSALWILAWFIPIVGTFLCLFQGFANMFFAGTRGANRFGPGPINAQIFD